ncbi:MAG: hypothetical protein GTO60_03810, partial [Gammaproteobacteria bacterium]|nr:hypothetical protein [Gammaproteobacteria bacterium]
MSEREAKREQFSEQEKSGSKKFLPVIVVLFAVIAAGGWFLFGTQSAGGPNVVSADQNGRLYFDAAEYDDGIAQYYRYNGKNGPIN